MRDLSELPDGWRIVRLGEVLDICRNGLVCPQDSNPSIGIPVSRIETISDGTIDWVRVGYAAPEHADPNHILLQGDILLSHINSVKHIGKVARKRDDRLLIHGMNLMRLRFSGHVDAGFGFALMEWAQTKKYFERRAKKAVNQASIHQKDIQDLPFALPPLCEQHGIAAVLDAIDEALERTEAVISATERLRDALLHELLTRGVPGWHTEWRTVPGLGTVPADWQVVRLEDVAHVQRGKFAHRPRNEPRFYGGATPFIQTGDVVKANGKITSHSQSLNRLGLSISRLFPAGTIVVTIAANIGETAITAYPVAFPDSLVGIIPTGIDYRFLEYFLRTQKTWLRHSAPESAQKNINLEDIRPMNIPVPGREEQDAIAAVLMGVEGTIEQGRSMRDTLAVAGSSTADALLSGRMRVMRAA